MKRLTSSDKITFYLDNFHNRTRQDWARFAQKTHHAMSTANGAARRHAKKHGKAGIWNSNDSLTLYYQVSGGLRQKTFPNARPNPVSFPETVIHRV